MYQPKNLGEHFVLLLKNEGRHDTDRGCVSIRLGQKIDCNEEIICSSSCEFWNEINENVFLERSRDDFRGVRNGYRKGKSNNFQNNRDNCVNSKMIHREGMEYRSKTK